ncbi:MAG TPA: two-component regulator propeller domain-containing protein, partial [Verrucomicrobiae bacterium]|nr:two-component regulator propeller domain-containing protein [Verrucomicrobiae bacterium]
MLAGFSSQSNAADISGNASAPFLIRSWQTEQGLPHNMILAITQTRDGYIWLGTAYGLARFDGVNCRVFGLQDGLKGVEISTLLEDTQGALWIGTLGGGLSRYFQGNIETFTRKDGLNEDAITALLQDNNGNIWVGTTRGIFLWQNERFNRLTESFGPIYVRAIVKDRQGIIWVATL